MARMLPPEPAETTQSNAERSAFEIIRKDLDGDWVALHSVGLATHPGKPWAEIDFVLIGPEGIFCLEVKGGRVGRRDDGRWEFTNGRGETSVKTEGPWAQVGSASAALYAFLVANDPELGSAAVGYGVVMPDFEFKSVGPDIELDVLYDVRDGDQPFSRYVEKLTSYWRARLHRQRGHAPRRLSDAAQRSALKLLRGDFDYRPSIRGLIDHAKRELVQLTEEQYASLDAMAENERCFIKGAAGTGKTLLAIEEARRLGRSGSRVFLCCFNRNLSHLLREAVAGVEGVEAGTLHAYMWVCIREAQMTDRMPDAEEDVLNSHFVPEVCCEALLEGDRLGAFDALVVDEAQDLMSTDYLDVLDAVLRGGLKQGHWRFFYDPNQDLFAGAQPKGVTRLLECTPARHTLMVNCRNTRQVAGFNQLLTTVALGDHCRVDGPKVVHLWYRKPTDELDSVAKEVARLLAEGVGTGNIVVLSPFRLANSCLAAGTVGEMRVVEWSDEPPPVDAIRFATIGAFKGLEADAILVVDVGDLESDAARQQLYVGLSRARVCLAVFLSESVRDQYQERAAEFGKALAALDERSV